MRVMLISGSLRSGSTTRAALQIVAEALSGGGIDVDFYDLGENRFPLYDPDAASVPADVQEFRQRVMAADGLVLGTPEYHSGMTGALENALDYIGSRYVKDKPVALLCSSGGGKGGMNALMNMRTVIRGVSGLAIPEQVIIDEDDFDADLQLIGSSKRERLVSLAHSLMRYAKLLELEKTGA